MNKKKFPASLFTLSWPSDDPKKIKIRSQVYPKLRRGLRSTVQWHAYEVILKYGGNIDFIEDITISALFATHDKNISRGEDLGTLWKKIILKRGKPEQKKLTEQEERELKEKSSSLFHFNRLLACKNSHELCCRLVPIISYAKSESIPVDYQKIYEDLTRFSDLRSRENIIKIWVQSYWRYND